MRKTAANVFVMTCSLVAIAALLAGCSALPRPVTFAKYQPTNIYRYADYLPPSIKRVAVLPLAVSHSTTLLDAGADALQPSLHAELENTKKFEKIVVPSDQLRRWTGRTSWKASDPLPPDFFKRLHQETGCDAVLFAELTNYRPYPTIIIGWKLTLVTSSQWRVAETTSTTLNPEILWSADELFNAGNPEVANAAEAYSDWNLRNESPLADSSSIFSSPVRFGQYSLNALFGTLPAR